MNRLRPLRKLLLAPSSQQTLLSPQRLTIQASRPYAVQSVTQPSFWTNLVPKPLRKSERAAISKQQKSKEWNPATFFIWIFLLIGSMSIQMITLRNETATFTRRVDAKIGLLKEIIGKIQNGEKVDVEGLLGTGDNEEEKEWEEGRFFVPLFFGPSNVALIQFYSKSNEKKSQRLNLNRPSRSPVNNPMPVQSQLQMRRLKVLYLKDFIKALHLQPIYNSISSNQLLFCRILILLKPCSPPL